MCSLRRTHGHARSVDVHLPCTVMHLPCRFGPPLAHRARTRSEQGIRQGCSGIWIRCPQRHRFLSAERRLQAGRTSQSPHGARSLFGTHRELTPLCGCAAIGSRSRSLRRGTRFRGPGVKATATRRTRVCKACHGAARLQPKVGRLARRRSPPNELVRVTRSGPALRSCARMASASSAHRMA
jgi:hypothetical protein